MAEEKTGETKRASKGFWAAMAVMVTFVLTTLFASITVYEVQRAYFENERETLIKQSIFLKKEIKGLETELAEGKEKNSSDQDAEDTDDTSSKPDAEDLERTHSAPEIEE